MRAPVQPINTRRRAHLSLAFARYLGEIARVDEVRATSSIGNSRRVRQPSSMRTTPGFKATPFEASRLAISAARRIASFTASPISASSTPTLSTSVTWPRLTGKKYRGMSDTAPRCDPIASARDLCASGAAQERRKCSGVCRHLWVKSAKVSSGDYSRGSGAKLSRARLTGLDQGRGSPASSQRRLKHSLKRALRRPCHWLPQGGDRSQHSGVDCMLGPTSPSGRARLAISQAATASLAQGRSPRPINSSAHPYTALKCRSAATHGAPSLWDADRSGMPRRARSRQKIAKKLARNEPRARRLRPAGATPIGRRPAPVIGARSPWYA